MLGISGILLVKAFTKERAERHRCGGINQELKRLEIRQTMIGRWFGLLNNVFFTLGPALLLRLGGSSGGDWPEHGGNGHQRNDHPRRVAGRIRGLAGQPVRQHHRLAGAVRRIERTSGRDRLVLTPFDKLDDPPSLLALRVHVAQLQPRIDLPEALLEIHTRTGFGNEFAHISESAARAKRP